ncbi:MAG: EpsG family protein [Porphyromonadaceae bacterium]|nr:EpsG family protein [Porphyromonadaceae bacterium]
MSPLSYYILFYTLFIGLLLAAKFYRQGERICLFLVWVLLTLFSGLRVGPGRDYLVYLNAYTDPMSSSAQYLETSWSIINHICRDLLGMPLHFWLMWIAGLTYALVLYGFRLWRIDWVWGILVYVLIYKGFFESLNTIRQCLAVSMVFAGSAWLVIDRKPARFVGSVLFASLFHSSAILSLVLYFLVYRKVSCWVMLASLSLSFVVGLTLFPMLIDTFGAVIPERYALYLYSDETATETASGLYKVFLNLFASFLAIRTAWRGEMDRRTAFGIRAIVLSVCMYNVLSTFEPGLRLMLYPYAMIFVCFPLMLRLERGIWRMGVAVSLLGFSVLTIKEISNPEEPYAHYQTVYDLTTPTDHMKKVEDREEWIRPRKEPE